MNKNNLYDNIQKEITEKWNDQPYENRVILGLHSCIDNIQNLQLEKKEAIRLHKMNLKRINDRINNIKSTAIDRYKEVQRRKEQQ